MLGGGFFRELGSLSITQLESHGSLRFPSVISILLRSFESPRWSRAGQEAILASRKMLCLGERGSTGTAQNGNQSSRKLFAAATTVDGEKQFTIWLGGFSVSPDIHKVLSFPTVACALCLAKDGSARSSLILRSSTSLKARDACFLSSSRLAGWML